MYNYDIDNQFSTPAMPLSDLLSSFDTASLRWICREDLSSATLIRWIARYPEKVESGDLILLDSDDDLDDKIKEIITSGAAAVGIVGNTEFRIMDGEQRALFERLPIFQVHSGPALRTIHQLLLQSLLSKKTIWIERSAQIQSRLTQITARGEGLTGLVAAMREMTQHGILVQDKRLSPLASSPTASLRPVWENLLEQLENFSTLPETLRDRRQAVDAPMLTTEPLPGSLERLITPIVVGDVARGYLSVIGVAGELDPTDRLVVEQGALVCAIEMARAKAVREIEKRLHGDLLSALLHQTLSARDARLWAQNTGLDLAQQHTAVRMSWEEAGPSLRRLETIVNGEVSRLRLHAIVSSMSGEVICFGETPREGSRPVAALALSQAVIDHAAEEYPDSIVRCGVGTPAADLSRWQESFRQAGQALDMARRLGERKPLYYMDLSVYRLLLQIEDHPDLQAFLQETLGSVLAHENAEELLATLEEYFAHNGNLSQTAGALYIHRNTLTYRMERIAAISGLDFNNPDTRLAAQLALRIYRMVKTTEKKKSEGLI